MKHATIAAVVVLMMLSFTGCTSINPLAEREYWTIRCVSITGPDQFRVANFLADSLKEVEQIKPDLVEVVFDEDGGQVYYGRYAHFWDSVNQKDTFRPDATPDLELIRSLSLDQVSRPFQAANLEPLPGESIGNPEWDAENVDGYWSLQVGAFYNTPTMGSRKQAAVEYCRLLRQQGEEAYFYHGPSTSSVLIGRFAKRAVRSDQGRRIGRRTVAANITADPELRDLQQRYPHNLENGHLAYELHLNTRTGKKERLPRPSFVVVLPKMQQALREADRERMR